MTRTVTAVAVCLGILLTALLSNHSRAADLQDDLSAIRAVGPKGVGHEPAVAALRRVSAADVGQLVGILRGMKGAGPLARNWLRSAAESVVQRADAAEQPLPTADLIGFLENESNDPHARRLAYEILSDHDPSFADKWKTRFVNDPSLELRRESVAVILEEAKSLLEAENKDAAQDKFSAALTAARDLDQIEAAAKALGDLGTKVDVNDVMGFITKWHVVAPFDNTDKSGFDVAYPPEKSVDLKATYKGKEGEIRWQEVETDEEFGVVDLNEELAKHKGAICYAYTEFYAADAQDVEIRLGCINGNKVWLNGQLLTSNHVYHANMFVDQYVAQGRLKPGKNTILVKVAQNEQTDSWAQRWQFQLRVCDALGTAVRSTK